jgi:PHP family Zn ribbon phosphoesterase
MNWRLSQLDRFALISNSDAHSPRKLARECNIFRTERTFAAMREALRTGRGFGGTIEFFPQEGKYHFDGHRACDVRLSPAETRAHGGLCPVCGKKVTIGVMHRVEELADRHDGVRPPAGRGFTSLIPLEEVIAEATGAGTGTKKVERLYISLLDRIGPELTVLRTASRAAIQEASSIAVAEGIARMRCGDITVDAGYDGEFGAVRLFTAEEREGEFVQLSFF